MIQSSTSANALTLDPSTASPDRPGNALRNAESGDNGAKPGDFAQLLNLLPAMEAAVSVAAGDNRAPPSAPFPQPGGKLPANSGKPLPEAAVQPAEPVTPAPLPDHAGSVAVATALRLVVATAAEPAKNAPTPGKADGPALPADDSDQADSSPIQAVLSLAVEIVPVPLAIAVVADPGKEPVRVQQPDRSDVARTPPPAAVAVPSETLRGAIDFAPAQAGLTPAAVPVAGFAARRSEPGRSDNPRPATEVPVPQVTFLDPVASAPAPEAPIVPAPARTTTHRAPVAQAGETVRESEATPRAPLGDGLAGLAPATTSSEPVVFAGDLAVAARASSPSPVAPGGSADATSSPRDFATLVDRLVEARQAATPMNVTAALAHADFGKVTMHFSKDGDGLAVAMASADPGFAPAVQAAAASQGMAAGSSQSDNLPTPQSRGQERGDGAAATPNNTAGPGQGFAATQGDGRRENAAPGRAASDRGDQPAPSAADNDVPSSPQDGAIYA